MIHIIHLIDADNQSQAYSSMDKLILTNPGILAALRPDRINVSGINLGW
ncbi:hypothetical protein MGWOODY_Mmi1886 [hydrothermal vent metagenome]|uniref:Uncharacterized protein n=1 Tax=hydrothermal vent metagenome TaxID=652676 RepID=A0A160VEP0_9ZZZZ